MMKTFKDFCRAQEIPNLRINELVNDDIPFITQAFQKVNWQKEASIFEKYLQEQEKGERLIQVAFYREQVAGYITLKWRSLYKPFRDEGIPEIMDFNVLPLFRKRGIGSHLLDLMEQEAAKKSKAVGIGVGLYAGPDGGYGAAQRLYTKRGYILDGRGVTYHYNPIVPASSYPIDDDLLLWFTKKLR